MRNNHWLVILACTIAHGAMADDTPAEKLTRIEAETALLKARARKVEVQAQIAGKNAEIAARNAEARRIAEQPGPAPQGPQLRAVEGVGTLLFATIEMPHGGTTDVRQGDTLPDGSRVVSVKPSEVVLETPAKRRVRLGRTTPSASQAADAPPMAPMAGAPYGGGMTR